MKFTEKILKKIEQTIETHKMLLHDDKVLVGVSGGPDSVALLHSLSNLSLHYSLKLGVAHLNHCLRGQESDRDAEFVVNLAEKYGLKCYIEKKNVKMFQLKNKLSLEEAARIIRYDFFLKIAKDEGFDRIALGHNADDNAELILLYLLRGSGPLGLTGIPPVRKKNIIRPLISINRYDIMEFLDAEKLKCVQDSSNTDTGFVRNRIRHELIPELKKNYNPEVVKSLNRLGSILRCEEEWIDESIELYFGKVVFENSEKKCILSVPELLKLHPAVKRRVIRKAIKSVKGNLRKITLLHIDTVCSFLKTASNSAILDFPDQVRVEKFRKTLIFTKEKKSLRNFRKGQRDFDVNDFEYKLFQSGFKPQTIYIRETGSKIKFSIVEKDKLSEDINTGQLSAYFDMDKLDFPMVIRNFRHGDRFTPLGMNGTQKLKKFFINNKIHREQRVKCPILLDDKKIVWIAGHRIDDSVKIGMETRTILKAELFPA